MNTKQGGSIRFFIYKEAHSSLYTAVCLDLDIIEQGEDPEELRTSIEEAARMHVESVIENNLDVSLLNRKAPKVYWNMARKAAAAYEESLEDQKPSKKLSFRDLWVRDPRELALA